MTDFDDDLTIDGTDLLAELLADHGPGASSIPGQSTLADRRPRSPDRVSRRWTPSVPETTLIGTGQSGRLQLAVVIGVVAAGIALGVLVAVIGR